MKRVRRISRTVICLLVCFCLVEVQPFYPFYGEVSAAECGEVSGNEREELLSPTEQNPKDNEKKDIEKKDIEKQNIEEKKGIDEKKDSEENEKKQMRIKHSEDIQAFLQEAGESGDISLQEETSGGMLLLKQEASQQLLYAEELISGPQGLVLAKYDSLENRKKEEKYLRQQGILYNEEQTYMTMLSQDAKVGNAVIETSEALTSQKQRNTHPVSVAVLDTGYSGSDIRVKFGENFTTEENGLDHNGHGTLLCDLILQYGSEETTVWNVKISNQQGRATAAGVMMGLEWVRKHHPDFVLFCLGADKVQEAELIQDMICDIIQSGSVFVVSAGNASEDTANYFPACMEEATVIAALDAKEQRAPYSNYGASVDYCQYGGSCGKDSKDYRRGTSVAAARGVGQMIAYAQNSSGRLDGLSFYVKDLGERGRDSYYGLGMISYVRENFLDESTKQEEGGDTGEEDKEGQEQPKVEEQEQPKVEEEEVFAYLSDELKEMIEGKYETMSLSELNDWLCRTNEWEIRFFLDHIGEDNVRELLKKDTVLTQENLTFEMSPEGTLRRRLSGTFYDSLYRQDFEEFYINSYTEFVKETPALYIYNAGTATINVSTNLGGTNGKISTLIHLKTNPASIKESDEKDSKGEYKYSFIKVSMTNGTYVKFDKASVGDVKLFTDDNGNTRTLGQIAVNKIQVKKPKHSCISGYGRKQQYSHGIWSGGFTELNGYEEDKITQEKCISEWAKGIHLAIGIGDMDESSSQEYYLNFKQGRTANIYGTWRTTVQPGCVKKGEKVRMKTEVCSLAACTETGYEKKEIEAKGHDFTNVSWSYGTDSGIENGVRYKQCKKNCGEKGWIKQRQYLHELYAQYMNIEGEYEERQLQKRGYYGTGAEIEGISYVDTGGQTDFLDNTGFKAYVCEGKADVSKCMKVVRKQFHIYFYDQDKMINTDVSQSLYWGERKQLSQNPFVREGYRFAGWMDAYGNHYDNLQIVGKEMVQEYNLPAIYLKAQWIEITDDDEDQGIHIRFDGNEGSIPEALLGEGRVYVPDEMQVERGKEKEVPFTVARLENAKAQPYLKFLGYSCSADDATELITNQEELAEKLKGQSELTFYAQWGIQANICYVGMGPMQMVRMTETLSQEQNRYVVGECLQSVIEYMEELYKDKITFYGWSSSDNYELQKEERKKGELLSQGLDMTLEKLILWNLEHQTQENRNIHKDIMLYSFWNYLPVITVSDMECSVEEAVAGEVTQERIAEYVIVQDMEDGRIEEDELQAAESGFCLWDYQKEEFLAAEDEREFTVCVKAWDTMGECVYALLPIKIVDLSNKRKGNLRFISHDSVSSLLSDSVWKKEDYEKELQEALDGEEVEEVWTFTKDQIEQIKEKQKDTDYFMNREQFLHDYGTTCITD